MCAYFILTISVYITNRAELKIIGKQVACSHELLNVCIFYAYFRSMFVVLDCQREESSPVKALATNWLVHVIQHGDIGLSVYAYFRTVFVVLDCLREESSCH